MVPASVARTAKVCDPSPRPGVVKGLEQEANAPCVLALEGRAGADLLNANVGVFVAGRAGEPEGDGRIRGGRVGDS